MKEEKIFERSQTKGSADEKVMIISSSELFGQNHFVYIEHEGQKYTLRVTRENKLILTK